MTKETLTFLDDDIARFMEEAGGPAGPRRRHHRRTSPGRYETAFRVIGRYIDEQKPRDVFFFEQDGAFVVRAADGRGQAGQPPRSSSNSPGTTSTSWSPGVPACATSKRKPEG